MIEFCNIKKYHLIMNTLNDIKETFGIALKRIREQNNLTQEQLAEKLNLETFQTINRIENGKTFVSGETFGKICDFFNVSPNYFFIKNPQIFSKESIDYKRKLDGIIPSLSENKLKYLYNIALILQD